MQQIRKSYGFVLLAVLATTFQAQAGPGTQQKAFFEQLMALCGATFVGEAVYPAEPGEAWRDQRLVATFASCSPDEIRIPLAVGEDHSRTWVITQTTSGLQLKHDHRHADGTPDEITQYGGTTTSAGTALAQSFPADADTISLIPEARSNQWFLSLSGDLDTLTYYLERHGAPRFKAVFSRAD